MHTLLCCNTHSVAHTVLEVDFRRRADGGGKRKPARQLSRRYERLVFFRNRLDVKALLFAFDQFFEFFVPRFTA